VGKLDQNDIRVVVFQHGTNVGYSNWPINFVPREHRHVR